MDFIIRLLIIRAFRTVNKEITNYLLNCIVLWSDYGCITYIFQIMIWYLDDRAFSQLDRFIGPETPCLLNVKKFVGVASEIYIKGIKYMNIINVFVFIYILYFAYTEVKISLHAFDPIMTILKFYYHLFYYKCTILC